MAQELTTASTPNALTAQTRVRVGALVATIERDAHYQDTLPAPLSKADRKDLEAYRRDLHARLRPASEASADMLTVRKAIAALLQSYVNAKTADPTATLGAYVSFLSDQPAWAVLAAVDDFRNRRVFDLNAEGDKVYFTLDHAPSAARILFQVKKHTDALEDERARAMRLLAITHFVQPEVSDEMRAKVGEQMRQLADSLKMRSAKVVAEDRVKIRAEAEEARARARRIKDNAAAARQQSAAAAG